MVKKILSSLLFLSSSLLFTEAQADMNAHTWHKVFSNKNTNFQLNDAYETGFYFVDESYTPITTFNVGPENPFLFGMVLAKNSTFNMLYTLTGVCEDSQLALSPKVCFVVGANGPAHPNIKFEEYYGAQGNWSVVEGVGENYSITCP